MIITIVLIVIFVLSLGILAYMLFKKIPQLKVIDPLSSKEAKAKELKQDILRKRLERATSGPLTSAKTTLGAPLMFFQGFVRGASAKLRAIERSYAERQKTGKSKLEVNDVRKILDEIRSFMHAEKFEEAEKKLIELITLDPKNVEAYEALGRLYILTRDFINAKETFSHVLKLAPKDASLHASMGEIAELEGDEKKAYSYFEKAKDLSPNNPKYLDFFIQAAIENGNFYEAEQALTHLSQVNPSNQKIPLLAERIEQGRKK
jgi:tetratricopeptide (TPR) repeat protein